LRREVEQPLGRAARPALTRERQAASHTMGIEYYFSCTPKALTELEAFLLRTGWERTERDPRCFDYWSVPKQPHAWPDATLSLGEARIYYCDHGGAKEFSAFLFRRVIDQLLTYSDDSDSIVITSI
jgi:hypothetical protein